MTPYNSIYLAPHLDDVALSCGGQIARQTRQGESVLIVTVMAGDPPTDAVSAYAQSLQERWQLVTDAAGGRRAEDREACRILGADFRHWTVPDCPYRLHPQTGLPFYVSDDDIFGDVHEAEAELAQELARELTALPRGDRILVPLTVGHHVDHLLTRQAAEFAFGPAGLSYYEDYPYAQQPAALETLFARERARWRSQVIPLDGADLALKVQAIAAYRSQLSTFWQDRTELERQVHGYSARIGGERIWLQQ